MAIAALALAGCAGTGGGGGATTGIVTVSSNEPENPLIPANTNEVGGGLILNNIMSGLVYYNADGSVELDDAASIESDDNQNWTITLRDGLKFSDGTPVTAESYVKAWQWGASDPENLNQWWFGYAIPFAGFSDDGGDDTLALNVVDDKTFTVELAQPQADFSLALVLPAAGLVLRRPGRVRRVADRQRPLQGGRGRLDPRREHHA